MTTDSYNRGLERSHNRRKKDAKGNCKGEEISQEIFGRINGTCNVFYDFELLIVECGFQEEGQTTLGDRFAQVKMKEYVSSRFVERTFSLWKQEDESKQLVDLEVQNEGREVGIALKQVIVEEK